MPVEAAQRAVDPHDHMVHLYDNDDDLSIAAGDYLASTLRAGEVAVMVATDAHRSAFEAT